MTVIQLNNKCNLNSFDDDSDDDDDVIVRTFKNFDGCVQLRWKPFVIPDKATAKVDFIEVNVIHILYCNR